MKEKIYLQKCVLVCTNILYARKKASLPVEKWCEGKCKRW